MNEMITVAAFNERDKAEVLQRRLKQAGVDAEFDDESAIQRARLFALVPMAHMRVLVPKLQVPNAKTLLAGWEADGAMQGAVRCPDCNSSRVQYPQFTRNFLLPNVLAAILWKLRLAPAEFYCEECQFTWPPQPFEKAPDLDPLYWPKDSSKHGPIGPR